MKVLRICSKDPVVESIRSLYSANPVRIPEARIRPLTLIGVKDGKTSFLGALAIGLADGASLTFETESGTLGNLNSSRSNEVSAEAAAEILAGFLSGFGLGDDGLAKVKAQLSINKEMTFGFSGAERQYVTPLSIGALVRNRQLDTGNPGLAPYLDKDRAKLYLIDSVIVSNNFNIQLSRTGDASIKLDVKAIQDALANGSAGLSAKSATGYEISFQGAEKLTFAFSCTKLVVDDTGYIRYIEGSSEDISFNATADERVEQDIPRFLLAEDAELIEFE